MPMTTDAAKRDRWRRYWDKHSASYDKQMRFLRTGPVRRQPGLGLLQAAGTPSGGDRHRPQPAPLPARDPADRRPTSARPCSRSPRTGPSSWAAPWTSARPTPRRCRSPMPRSTPWSAPSRCAPSRRGPRGQRDAPVLRAGGLLLLADHIAGGAWPVRAIQRILEVVTVPLQGEHFLRRPLRQVQAEGMEIERRERFKLGIVERVTARKPAQPKL